MPGTLIPGQMFTHELNPVKAWPSPYALDKALKPNVGISLVAGQCVSIDASTSGPGALLAKLGVLNGDMPLFAFQGKDEFDVNGDVGNIITGTFNTLVATGAYELESTEFVAGTYYSNDPLTSPTAGINAGNIEKCGLDDSVQIVGIVSDGKLTNSYGMSVVRFWPVYCPLRCCTSSSSGAPTMIKTV